MTLQMRPMRTARRPFSEVPVSRRYPVVLVDGSSYLYRAFFALPPLTAPSGLPTGAVYGVINMLKKLVDEQQPQFVAVVFDAKGKTFRDELFAEYKSQRPPMPDDLAVQIEPIHDLVRASGLPILSISGVEADDVIGTLARGARAAGHEVLISTGDKDMAQLVDEHTHLINTMSDTLLDPDGVMKKFGVRPDQIIDYLGLAGDTSDNIPGVPKVGPKTAVKWLGQFGSVDEIIARAEEVKGKVGESLRDNIDNLKLSRQLATIKCDVDLEVTLDDLQQTPPDLGALRELYTDLGFRKLLEQLTSVGDESDADAGGESGAIADNASAARERSYEVVLDLRSFDAWIAELESAERFAFDTETTSLNYNEARIVGVSFAVDPCRAAYVPLKHNYVGAPEQLDRDAVLARLKPLLEDPARGKVGHHLKYDAHVLANHGIQLTGISDDTMLQSYVLDPTGTRHDLDSVAKRYLEIDTVHYEDVAGKGAKQIPFAEVPIEIAGPYAAEDADISLCLAQTLRPRLAGVPKLLAVYDDLERPLVPVLTQMETHGVLIDSGLLEQQTIELSRRMATVQAEAFELAGGPFNLSSPKQLQEILFGKLGLEPVRKTPKGQPSTAEDVLEVLAQQHELPKLIVDHRGLAKLVSTYTEKLPEMVDAVSGRVHTSYHQAVAATGRLSSSDPNLQNIPIRTEEGRRIRKAFIAPPGKLLLAADYSQIELRIMAHLSSDDGLLAAFSAGDDVHRATAAEVFGEDLEAVTTDQRRSAKAINFGLIYGMSAFGLGRQLGIPQGQAADYISRYFDRYPGVKAYMEATRERARGIGWVETISGRRLYIQEIDSRNYQRRQYAERSAINAPMQGSAADIIKRAMIEVFAWLPQSDIDAHLIMQVHDELVFEVAEDQADALAERVVTSMAAAGELSVPLVVDVGRGANWDEAH
jgi:DNA polymerase I